MILAYPYNEILPTRKAHDVFLFQEVAHLAERGCEVEFFVGRGSKSREELASHYQAPLTSSLHLRPLPILRKNNFLGISWNLPFFYFTQKQLEKLRPDVVVLSVRKQAHYHLARKLSNTLYVYEVHELLHYPSAPAACSEEREMLQRADLIITTTEALQEILQNPPYSLQVPIVTVPLAVRTTPLPPPTLGPLTIAYVGQLYKGQGLPLLIEALPTNCKLKIIGGKPEEIAALKKSAPPSVTFCGFHPPSELPALLSDVHAFVAPFEATGRMPYVAHTKLLEYAAWGRPIIAPDLPVVCEHFPEGKGVIFFEAGNASSLAVAIRQLPKQRERLQEEIVLYREAFSWAKRAERILSVFAQASL